MTVAFKTQKNAGWIRVRPRTSLSGDVLRSSGGLKLFAPAVVRLPHGSCLPRRCMARPHEQADYAHEQRTQDYPKKQRDRQEVAPHLTNKVGGCDERLSLDRKGISSPFLLTSRASRRRRLSRGAAVAYAPIPGSAVPLADLLQPAFLRGRHLQGVGAGLDSRGASCGRPAIAGVAVRRESHGHSRWIPSQRTPRRSAPGRRSGFPGGAIQTNRAGHFPGRRGSGRTGCQLPFLPQPIVC